MADETLTLRMRSRGASGVQRDVDGVGRTVRRLGRDAATADRNTNLFSRGLSMLGTRAGMFAILGAGAAAAAAVASPAMLAMTAGAVAMGAAFAPAFAIATGAALLFKQTSTVAGSAASELTDVLYELKHAFMEAITPAASVVMRSLSTAIVTMLGPLQKMRGPLLIFGRAMGQGLEIAANGFAALAPQVAALITSLAPELPRLAHAAVLFVAALLQIARYGVPVFHDMVTAVMAFARWLGPAIDDVARWASANMHISADAWTILSQAVQWLAQVLTQVWGIAQQLFLAMEPLSGLFTGALLLGLTGVSKGLAWLNDNFGAANYLVGLFANAILAYWAASKLAGAAQVVWNTAVLVGKGIMMGVTAIAWAAWWINVARAEGIAAAAQLALNTAMEMNPIGVIVMALAALAGALYFAYTRSASFRNVVQAVWHWVTQAASAVGGAFVDAFQWLGDKADWLYSKLKPVLDIAMKVAKYSPLGLAARGTKAIVGHVSDLFKADGGPVAGDRPYVVGERGPELFVPGSSGRVVPNHQLHPTAPGVPDDFVIEATFLMPDGSVLAQQTLKAAKKKKSTR